MASLAAGLLAISVLGYDISGRLLAVVVVAVVIVIAVIWYVTRRR